MAVTATIRWAPAIAFLGGFAGGDSAAVALVAVSACLQGGAVPRGAWRWALLAVTAWAAGTAVATLVVHAGAEPLFDVPDGAQSGLVVLAALAGAYVGAVLTWVGSRLARQG